MHYNACWRGEFGEKCIIMHFLGTEKDRKVPECRDAEKDLRKNREEIQLSMCPGPLKVAPTIFG